MITEHYMDPGSFHVPLKVTAPYDLLEKIVEFGNLVVTPQHINPPDVISDVDLLTAARYAGVVLEVEWADGALAILGQGMGWYLGDTDGKGPIIEAELSFSAATLSTILQTSTGVLPDAIEQGTITLTGLNTFTGLFQWELPIAAIRTVMTDLNAHYRVNPNGTIDASKTTQDEVFVFTSPSVVVVRHGWGSDPTYDGVPSRRLVTRRDAYEFVTKLLILDEEEDGTFTLVDSDTVTHSYKDIHGNALLRSVVISKPATEEASLTNYMTNELALLNVNDEQEIETDQYEISGGNLNVGDMFWIYDPPSGFVDTDNEIWFRGQTLWPKKTRLLEASWPVADGMGVYYRPDTATTSADWIDLTRYIDWERG